MKNLQNELKTITDPRRTRYGNIRHKLEDIIVIGLCTIICGGENYINMEEFGIEREQWLRNFLELPNGIPDSDTFRRIFERLDPDELSVCLYNWLKFEWSDRPVIAVDGKTIKGSGNKQHKAYHVVSAFVAENQITFGEIAVSEKSNEITAVPELLDLLDIEDAIITADAMSCQKKIVKKISDKKADYVIALKNNQRSFAESVHRRFESTDVDSMRIFETVDKHHRGIEQRIYCLETDISWLDKRDEWEELKSVGYVKTIMTTGENRYISTRYFISSLTSVHEFAYAVRKHWAIENQLHWCLDVVFREDAARARKDNSPLNMNVLRKMAIALIGNVKTKRVSFKRMMFRAALNSDVLETILSGV